MNRATICLGANGPDADVQIARAADMVHTLGIATAATEPYRTEPEFAGDAAPYLNMIVMLDCPLDYDEALRLTKRYQEDVRRKADCAPFVAIDIDVVAWNGAVMRPADAASRYFRKGLELLKERAQYACDATTAPAGIAVGEA